MFQFELGDRVEDTVTEIQGIVTARHEYFNGCLRYTVESQKDGELKELYFDEARLGLVRAEAVSPPRPAERTGGPQNAPTRQSAGR